MMRRVSHSARLIRMSLPLFPHTSPVRSDSERNVKEYNLDRRQTVLSGYLPDSYYPECGGSRGRGERLDDPVG
jgi:hypothetical protein